MGGQERQRQGARLRCRLPPGFEALEPPVRAAAAPRPSSAAICRSRSRSAARPQTETVRINEAVLDQVVAAGESAARAHRRRTVARRSAPGAARRSRCGRRRAKTKPQSNARNAAMLASFSEALAALWRRRAREEGARLEAVARGADRPHRGAGRCGARQSGALGRSHQGAACRAGGAAAWRPAPSFDRDRLHQEAVLIATRADIQEELDRLFSHVEAARALLAVERAVGRKFDFLAQEFNREANTLCSKAIDRSLTAIGLDSRPSSTRCASRSRTSSEQTMTDIPRRGLLLVMSSPSGAGKTTLSRRLLAADPQHHHVGVGDHARRRAPARSTARTITSSPRRISRACATRGDFSNMPRCSAISTERRAAGGGGAGAGPRRAVRYRLAGHPATGPGHGGRSGPHLHPAAVGRGTARAPDPARPGFRHRRRQAHGRGLATKSATGRNTTMSSSTTISRTADARSMPSSPPNA